MPGAIPYEIYPCGDHAITVSWGNRIDHAINQKAVLFGRQLKQLAVRGIRDIIPAYASVTIVYDLGLLVKEKNQKTVYASMVDLVHNLLENNMEQIPDVAALKQIPVCYDQSFAPDLPLLAKLHEREIDEIIALHTGTVYRVFMTGFLPGFPYMGKLPAAIASPRKESPRAFVPAGSVGIAGEQTGIYPVDSPGGWQIIGRTPVRLFDKEKINPCFLAAGDEVQFYPISLKEYHQFKQ
ncbi:MAG: hypothetical protein RLZZ28_1314 [Bacteroidota bacterium]|jgi:inhibitor of KinA